MMSTLHKNEIKPAVCVVGVGAIGSLHLELHENRLSAENIGIVEVDTLLAEKMRGTGHAVFASLEESFASHYDIYDICLPTFLHKQAIEMILSHTSAKIMCEKPLVLNHDELISLEAGYPMLGERLVCAYVERFNEPFLEAEAWAQKHPGPYTMSFVRRTKKPLRQDWFAHPEQGGDVILDLGIHDIDAALWFSGSSFDRIASYARNKDNEVFSIVLVDGTNVRFEIGWDVPQDSEIGIINTFSIEQAGHSFVYESSEETILADGMSRSVKPRFPHAYQAEIDESHRLVSRTQANYPDFNTIEQAYCIIDAVTKERNHE